MSYEKYCALNVLIGLIAVWKTHEAGTEMSLSGFVLELSVVVIYILLSYVFLLREYEDWLLLRLKKNSADSSHL